MAGSPDLSACAVGLDVGGTKVAAGIVAYPSGAVICRRTIPTLARRGGKAVLDDSLALANELIAETGRRDLELLGIGVGVPELVDPEGHVTSAHSISGWQGDRVRSAFSSLAPTVVESDVRAGALAESMFGAGQEFRLFVYVTVGTGQGDCI